MLVSADAGHAVRRAVDAGERPMPEYLALERDYAVKLIDWSRVGITPGRSPARSVRQAQAARRAAADTDVVFSDGEHVGIPLGAALQTMGPVRPHVMLGHHLTTWPKPLLLRWFRHAGITRVLVHSRRQLEIAVDRLGFGTESAALVPYYADARFWRPQPIAAESLIVAAGREHRDYATLAAALGQLNVRAVIASGSLFSPGAACRMPRSLPWNVTIGMRNPVQLRELYARARIVVVPLLPNDFQAGVTTILEAMAMGKPVIVSATAGQGDVVVDGETGVLVPPGDPGALLAEIRRLLHDQAECERLGANARQAVLGSFDLPIYAAALYRQLRETSRRPALAA